MDFSLEQRAALWTRLVLVASGNSFIVRHLLHIGGDDPGDALGLATHLFFP
jgi:hypothetical protein